MNIPKVRLGDVCEVRAGRDYKDVQSDDGAFPIYGTGGIMGRSTEARCPANSVIVGRKGTLDNPMLIREPFWNIDTCFGVIPNDKLDAEYLWRFCQKFDFYSLVPASGRPSTTSDAIKGIQLPLPDLLEQRRIVQKVDKAMKRVDAIERQFDKLNERAKSYFQNALNQCFTTLSSECKGTAKIDDICTFMTSGSRGWAKFYSTSGDLFITIKNVRHGVINTDNIQHVNPPCGAEAERTRVREGDLLISITADLGRTGVVDKTIANQCAYINQHLICIRLKQDVAIPLFVAYCIESSIGKRQIEIRNKDAVKDGLNFNRIKTIQIPLPPLQKQKEVVEDLLIRKGRGEVVCGLAARGLANCARMRKAILAEAFI